MNKSEFKTAIEKSAKLDRAVFMSVTGENPVDIRGSEFDKPVVMFMDRPNSIIASEVTCQGVVSVCYSGEGYELRVAGFDPYGRLKNVFDLIDSYNSEKSSVPAIGTGIHLDLTNANFK